MKFGVILYWVSCGFISAQLAACAGAATSAPQLQHLSPVEVNDEPKTISDPNEEFNRSVFESNQQFNHAVLYPVAKAYNENVPQGVRDRVDAFTTNLAEPMVFANDVLQLRFKAAATTLGRVGLNSTLGLGGLFDVAHTQGLAKQSGDLGQTMYVWGYRDSTYLVLPIVGPTNFRDAIATGVELGVQQIPTPTLLSTKVAAVVRDVNLVGSVTGPLTNISKAGDMQSLEESSIDFYSMLRSVSSQKRQAELQEALDTSALTGAPQPRDPNAIEPVTEIVSSPTMLKHSGITDVSKLPRRQANSQNGIRALIGPPILGDTAPER